MSFYRKTATFQPDIYPAPNAREMTAESVVIGLSGRTLMLRATKLGEAHPDQAVELTRHLFRLGAAYGVEE